MQSIMDNLAFSPSIFLIQVGIFILLLVVMNYLFWKPVLAHLKLRDKEITDAYSQRDRLQHEMEQLRVDYLARLAVVEADARSHIQAAVKEAQTERERILAEARAASEEELRSGIANMEREMAEALRSMRPNMVGLAMEATTKALGAGVDSTRLRASIEERITLESARA